MSARRRREKRCPGPGDAFLALVLALLCLFFFPLLLFMGRKR